MSIYDYVPTEEGKLVAWLESYYEQCVANQEELGLSEKSLLDLLAEIEEFKSGYGAIEIIKAQLRAAVTGKNNAKIAVVDRVRALTRGFKADENVTPATLSGLGVLKESTGSALRPIKNLTVQGKDDGVNILKWNRNGNAPGTIFLIEFRASASEPWQYAEPTTKTKFSHQKQIPGRKLFYRVSAFRGGVTSNTSAPVVVYGDTENTSLLAVA
jgi:hypothetical protein